jgi:hypothetical protein
VGQGCRWYTVSALSDTPRSGERRVHVAPLLRG